MLAVDEDFARRIEIRDHLGDRADQLIDARRLAQEQRAPTANTTDRGEQPNAATIGTSTTRTRPTSRSPRGGRRPWCLRAAWHSKSDRQQHAVRRREQLGP